MPSKKQRRRRQKERRHDYEYVYLDDEGHEVPVDPEEVRRERSARQDGRKEAAQTRGGTRARTTRPGRTIDPPSWRRVGRRALLFAPMMFIAIHLLGGKKLTVTAEVTQTAVLLLFFLPFSYFMDSLMYKQYLRRTGGSAPRGPGRRERTS